MVKKAIIIFSDKNALMPVFGVPIIKRLLVILRQIGIKNILIIGKAEHYDEISALSDEHFMFYPVNEPEQVEHILNKQIFHNKEDILVLKANHVIDKYSLKELLKESGKQLPCALVSDENAPVFLVPSSNIKSAINFLWKGGQKNSFVSSIKKIKTGNKLPFLVNGVEDIKKAEDCLVNSLSRQKIETDSLIARYFDRHISLFFSKKLAHKDITPNQITLIGMSIGLIGAFLLSRAGYWTQLIGSFLFLFCVIVDGIDGELARLKLKESSFGHYLDIITDNIVHVAIFIGMGVGLYTRTGNKLYLYLIWILLAGFGLCAISVYQCILKKGEEELKSSPFLIKFMSFLTNRDFAYLIALLAILDKLNWFFIATAIGSYLFSITLWVVSFLYKKKNYPVDSSA